MNKKIKIISGFLLVSAAVLVAVGNGCSKRFDFSSNSSSSSSNAALSVTEPEDYIPGAKVASVVYAKQALNQLTSCVGLGIPSENTFRVYKSKEGSISANGESASLTAPMLLALANVSGEVCDDLIDQEIKSLNDTATDPTNTLTNPRFFIDWQLAANQKASPSSVNATISRFANTCWNKSIEQFELQQVEDLVNSVQVTTQAGEIAQRRQALLLCTAMLASLNTILN